MLFNIFAILKKKYMAYMAHYEHVARSIAVSNSFRGAIAVECF